MSWPRSERISIGLSGLRAIARRVPSGEITQVGTSSTASSRSKSNRANSGPRPFIGSRIETIICLRFSLWSSYHTRVGRGPGAGNIGVP